MEKKIININENSSIVINYEDEKDICWANVYLKKNNNDIYLGYYSPKY